MSEDDHLAVCIKIRPTERCVIYITLIKITLYLVQNPIFSQVSYICLWYFTTITPWSSKIFEQ